MKLIHFLVWEQRSLQFKTKEEHELQNVKAAKKTKRKEAVFLKKLNKIRRQAFDTKRLQLEKQRQRELKQLRRKQVSEDKNYQKYQILRYKLEQQKDKQLKNFTSNLK